MAVFFRSKFSFTNSMQPAVLNFCIVISLLLSGPLLYVGFDKTTERQIVVSIKLWNFVFISTFFFFLFFSTEKRPGTVAFCQRFCSRSFVLRSVSFSYYSRVSLRCLHLLKWCADQMLEERNHFKEQIISSHEVNSNKMLKRYLPLLDDIIRATFWCLQLASAAL